MSSAYVVRFTGVCDVGIPDGYMLNSVGNRTLPSGTTGLNWN